MGMMAACDGELSNWAEPMHLGKVQRCMVFIALKKAIVSCSVLLPLKHSEVAHGRWRLPQNPGSTRTLTSCKQLGQLRNVVCCT